MDGSSGSRPNIVDPLGADGIWPIEPDPRLTNLRGRQDWHLHDGHPVAAAVAGRLIGADDARIAQLGIRRDSRDHAFPAAFAHAPDTGERLGACVPLPDPALLDLDADSTVEVPLPSGRPTLFRAGRPAALYLFQDTLGALEVWTGRAFATLGRLPASPGGSSLALGREGLAYTTVDALVSVTLPQLGPGLAHVEARLPGLRFLSAPCWRGADLLALAERDGRLIGCRAPAGSDVLALSDTGITASGGPFSGPWTNRLGDAVWTGPDGFVTWRACADEIYRTPWPDGFVPIAAQVPWRDDADTHHQLGLAAGRYHVAALSPDTTLRPLDGPRLAAGTVAYWGAEYFAAPWRPPVETLSLGIHAGSLLVPLLAMPRDTVLLALDLDVPRGDFARGAALMTPATGYVLHHAHGAGLRRLPVSLDVTAIQDAGALLHDGTLYLWSRSARRCHALRLRPA
ncbi:hypothetical protein [Methylobacterium sp. J-070]|uniref:hypothetical protein n=1 Tax=Methylobacterium sp. J-070 TaxID=2836650 RepID=UPI001FBB07AD|nr:hypothetical protein [Methylobacterium sp. J-070]MCJ2054284.1 hypothetical protein [Methylobacterium sp. J-070]